MTKREKVYNKYDGHCAYCGKEISIKNMQIDHIFPKRLDGLYDYGGLVYKGKNIDELENLNPSCRRCNHYKRALTLESFRLLMTTLHERVSSPYISKVAIDYGIITVKPFNGQFYFEKL